MATFDIIKDPGSVLDYTIDWTSALNGDTVSTSTWTADNGLVVDSNTIASPAVMTTVWVSAGNNRTYASLKNTIVTAAARTLVRTILVQIQAR